jgi:hypothetical protein
MKIKEYSSNNINLTSLNVLTDLESKEVDVAILRNFLTKNEIQELISVYKSTKNWYVFYDGCNAYPRPFDHISRNSIDEYRVECNNFLEAFNKNETSKRFQKKLKSISTDYSLEFNDASKNINDSETWSSFKQLASGKGYFEIHCGRLFQDWNKSFFERFARKADIDTQFAFLTLLQRPENDCDIEIFDLKWDEVSTKIDKNNLQRKNGEVLPIDQIKSVKFQLNVGDVLIFDEGNFWHLVPPFNGNLERISFGGFITKLLDNNNYLVWS